MNNFRRQQLRGGFVTVVTALLLVVSVAFSIIGYAASDGTKQQLSAVESRYTTIGALTDQNAQYMQYDGIFQQLRQMYQGGSIYQWIWKNHEVQEDGTILWEDGTVFRTASEVENVAREAPQIRTIARSAILSAHVEGVYGLTSGTQNRLQFNEAFDSYSYTMAVFVGTCTSPDIVRSALEGIDTSKYAPNAVIVPPDPFSGVPVVEGDYTTTVAMLSDNFHIDQIVSMHPTYSILFSRNKDIYSTMNYDMSVITDLKNENIVQGKQYIVRCFIRELPVVQIESKAGDTVRYTYRRFSGAGEWADVDATTKHFLEGRNTIEWSRTYTFTYPQLSTFSGVKQQLAEGPQNFALEMKRIGRYNVKFDWITSGKYYYTAQQGSLPFYAEFEGELEDFLNSEEGHVWRDVIIPMAEINQQSATVMLVDDLDYLHAFNSGKAVIMDGRSIDASEFVRGDKVCVVSTAYADYAGLEVGDKINLDFYDTGFFLTSANIENWNGTDNEFVMVHNPLQESNRIGYQEDYTIVGIYSAPEYEYGTTSFYADTIFVPKASVPNAEEYEDPSLPILNNVVLMNGTTEEFEEYMESKGYGGSYTYFDQDYSSTIAGLQSLSQNALRLVILAGAVFFVTAILFYYLNFKRMIPVAYGMRRMGQHPLKLWWQMEMVTIPVILIAVFGGAFLGVYFFEYVTLELFETNIIMDIETVKWLTLLEAAALCAISLLVAIPISMPRLMKRK